jgi:hypothetical protein
MAKMKGDIVEASFSGSPSSLGIGLNQFSIDFGRYDTALGVANKIFVVRAPGNRARYPARPRL